MRYVCVDIEADGPSPSRFSMVEIGAVVVERQPDTTWGQGSFFSGGMCPVTPTSDAGALTAIGATRPQLDARAHPSETMQHFAEWAYDLKKDGSQLRFVSDNAGFDWMFVCDYLHRYVGKNPFGFSSLSLTSFYAGIARSLDMRGRGNFRYLRDTKHTHCALDDARGNAEALCKIFNEFGIEGA